MAGRFNKPPFAYTPVGTIQPNGKQVRWELINIFRYADEARVVEEWVQTDYDSWARLGGESPGRPLSAVFATCPAHLSHIR